uniref:Uncharacterized protein n=1 Tax=Knipowitschia caucasica TaxID=637954 RepID=A0AAV2MS34_KNICA
MCSDLYDPFQIDWVPRARLYQHSSVPPLEGGEWHAAHLKEPALSQRCPATLCGDRALAEAAAGLRWTGSAFCPLSRESGAGDRRSSVGLAPPADDRVTG